MLTLYCTLLASKVKEEGEAIKIMLQCYFYNLLDIPAKEAQGEFFLHKLWTTKKLYLSNGR